MTTRLTRLTNEENNNSRSYCRSAVRLNKSSITAGANMFSIVALYITQAGVSATKRSNTSLKTILVTLPEVAHDLGGISWIAADGHARILPNLNIGN
ncbi:MAG TPA: hypothetical protein VGG72_05860 [Bryobacteraceae bacterium]